MLIRRTGTDHHKRTQPKQVREGDAAAEKEPISNIEGSTSVILADVV